MKKNWWRRTSMLLIAVTMPVALAAAPATAAPETPNGYIGACNMVRAWGVGMHGGMEWAMIQNTRNGAITNGNDGMSLAVTNSGGYCP
jgi:hypothetical protein